MLDKIINFFIQYFDETEIKEKIKTIGKYKVASIGIISLLRKNALLQTS